MEKINMRQYFDYESCAYSYLLFDPYTNKSVIIDPVLEQSDRVIRNFKKIGRATRRERV